MDIATQTETITTTTMTFIVKLTEAEVNTALVDARPLQRELRKARNAQIAPAANWATAGYAGHPSRTVKAKRGRPAKPEKKNQAAKAGKPPIELDHASFIDCPHGCGQHIKARGLKMHERHCPRYQLHKAAVNAQSAAFDD